MQFPIIIGLHRSRFMERGLIAIALSAGCAILALPHPPALLATLLLLAAVVLRWSWRQLSPSLSALRLERDGSIQAAGTGNAAFGESTLRGTATVHPWLTVFRLELADGRRHTVVIARGSTTEEDFRRLRVFLRWQAQFSAADDSREAPYS